MAIKRITEVVPVVKEKKEKLPRGRPPKYQVEYCDKIIEMYSAGGDHFEFCAEVGISDMTFYNWRDNYEEFKEAWQRADTLARNFYNKEYRKQGLSQEKYPNASQLFTYMRQRWPKEFSKDPTASTVNNLTINSIDGKSYVEIQQELNKLLSSGIVIDQIP